MTPNDAAIKLMSKHNDVGHALITVDEVLNVLEPLPGSWLRFWNEVKSELEKQKSPHKGQSTTY